MVKSASDINNVASCKLQVVSESKTPIMSNNLQTFRVVVAPRAPQTDEQLITAAAQLGLTGIESIYGKRLYFIQGDFGVDSADKIATDILADPVTEELSFETLEGIVVGDRRSLSRHTIDVTYLPGVTDPAADNLRRAAAWMGFDVVNAATGMRYEIVAQPDADLEGIATRVLSNPVVQQATIDAFSQPPFVEASPENDFTEIIALTEADDDELLDISRERRLSLDLAEMQAIQTYYRSAGREPTDVELEMLAQTWSEHCVHKTFRAKIDFTGENGEQETIDGLLKTYIRAATEKINKPWVRSAFVDDAGIIRFDDEFDVAFKVETHNHPSALEPFGGANTGVGGVIRDVLGVSARPIANTDILCFGDPDMSPDDLPAGVLHPSRVADGVVHGIEDYGNKMGIPTVNGSIVYHNGYTSNPLVYCGCVGILPHGTHKVGAQPGDLIVAIGGKVGRDGLRGATFSSMEMDQSTSDIAGTAVQIGHPIMEKQVLEVVLRCRDEGLYTALTDCGAGGYSSSVGEMGEETGASVQLKNVSLKYPGLRPWEIWLSEAQERMVLAVPLQHLERVKEIAAGQDVEAVELGVFDGSGQMTIRYGEKVVADFSMEFLHDGIPQRQMVAKWQPPTPDDNPVRDLMPTQEALLKLLQLPTIRSKEDVIRRYDHEVQTGTAVKPLVGVANAGPSDATVIVPQDSVNSRQLAVNSEKTAVRGFSLSNGICPTYGELDPYAMAWAAVDEAMRNAVAVGTNPDEVAILDNFCWGNPLLPDRLGALVRCAQGCHDAAVAYRTPFISGKDSLNNEYVGADGEKHAIPGTILISAIGMVPDVDKTVTMDLKAAGNKLFVIGDTRAEMGGSYYAKLHNENGGTAPQPVTEALPRYRALHRAIREGLVEACHDLSEGGLGVALAEMALAGRLGAEVSLKGMVGNVAHDDVLLFSESIGRFLIEVKPENIQQLQFQLAAEPLGEIGTVTDDAAVVINGYDGDQIVNISVAELEQAWRGHVGVVNSEQANLRLDVVNSNSDASYQVTSVTATPKVAIIHANGTNRDRDAALAIELAGGQPEIIHLNQLIAGERNLLDYGMLVVPGGFSYGDDLGAGVLFSAEFRHRLTNDLREFVADGRPTLGICNGFQVLVKAGIFSSPSAVHSEQRKITLTYNENGHFECRWVYLEPNQQSNCLFTKGLTEPIYCPVAHGEGRFMVADDATATYLTENNLVALTYQSAVGSDQSAVAYPDNPNGSVLSIAGITNSAGNVLGLMPHPENHIFPWQHPRRHRGEAGLDGLRLFVNGVKNA